MNFYKNQLFHIYNQGNNRRQVYFNDENYRFFIWKMRAYLPPFGDLISYCLMPNHFHWQFYVRATQIDREQYWKHVDRVEFQRRQRKYGAKAIAVDRAHTRVRHVKTITLNEGIACLLKSYVRAISKPKDWTGKVFREATKAQDGWIDEFVTLKKPNGQLDTRFQIGTGYAHHCFNYIHNNPVAAGLATSAADWKFSSARDYEGLRKGTLCKLKLGREIIKNL